MDSETDKKLQSHSRTHSHIHTCTQIANNKRYAGNKGWTVSECAERVGKEMGNIDILVRVGLCVTVCEWSASECAECVGKEMGNTLVRFCDILFA